MIGFKWGVDRDALGMAQTGNARQRVIDLKVQNDEGFFCQISFKTICQHKKIYIDIYIYIYINFLVANGTFFLVQIVQTSSVRVASGSCR